ncbi:MAG: YlxR family protein [Eggerthellaceae bacterium]|nr:YlxR family protein [Eggerthellaceae bacterium]
MMNKHIAYRTCVGCGEVLPKVELLRFVHDKTNNVFYDKTNNALGRGAYVCGDVCFAKAIKTKRLARCLRTSIDDERAKALFAQAFEHEK